MEFDPKRRNERARKLKKALRRAKQSIETIFTDAVQHIDDFTHKIDCTIAAHKTSLSPLPRESICLSNLKKVHHLAMAAYNAHINENEFSEVNYDDGRQHVPDALSVPMLHRLCTDTLLPKQFMWYFETMMSGTLASFYIREYMNYNKHLYTTLIRAFKNFHIPKNKIVEYLGMIHRYKPPIPVDDLQVAFLEYGFKSKEFESFLEANPLFDLRSPPPYPLPEQVQIKFWLYMPTVWISYLSYGFPIKTDEDVMFRNDFIDQLLPCVYPSNYHPVEVPTLQQRARDAFREYIHGMCPCNQPLAFYNRINRLKLPDDIKGILLLKTAR